MSEEIFFFYLMSQEIGHENKNVDLFLCMLYGTSPIGHRCEEAVLDYELMLSVRLCGINSWEMDKFDDTEGAEVIRVHSFLESTQHRRKRCQQRRRMNYITQQSQTLCGKIDQNGNICVFEQMVISCGTKAATHGLPESSWWLLHGIIARSPGIKIWNCHLLPYAIKR